MSRPSGDLDSVSCGGEDALDGRLNREIRHRTGREDFPRSRRPDPPRSARSSPSGTTSGSKAATTSASTSSPDPPQSHPQPRSGHRGDADPPTSHPVVVATITKFACRQGSQDSVLWLAGPSNPALGGHQTIAARSSTRIFARAEAIPALLMPSTRRGMADPVPCRPGEGSSAKAMDKIHWPRQRGVAHGDHQPR